MMLALLAALVAVAPAAAGPASLYQGPGPRPGPDLLYEPPATSPQLTNAGVWRAPPILVSGATAYRDGEFLYQDFLYDDHGARGDARDPGDERTPKDSFSAPYGTYTYPTDPRYADNAADLVEMRVRPLADATAFRLTYNTFIDPEVVGTTISIGTSATPLPMPHGANASTKAELFLTVHGDEADLLRAGTGTSAGAPAVTVDRERRQLEVRVPKTAWDPGRGVVRLGAASGLWNPQTDAYVRPSASRATATQPGGAAGSSASAFFNVAFRYEIAGGGEPGPDEEPLPDVRSTNPASNSLNDPRWWRDKRQGDALRTGELSAFAAEVDFGRLADGASDDMPGQPRGVPQTGAINRILASHFEPGQGVDFATRECNNPNSCTGELRGRLQPYAIYVPTKPRPARGHGLTLLLHSLGANFNQFTGSRNQAQFGERGQGSIVITPAGRGPDGWYYDLAGADTFEVWADVAARYDLDPDRTSIAGYSMGGYGTYKFATRYPDLFARAQPTVGPPTLGISFTGRDSTGGEKTSTMPQLESVRHVPFLMWVGSTDDLVPISGTTLHAQRFDDLGLRYAFDVFTPAEHFTLAINDQFAPAADFLGDAEVVRDPPRVSYTANPTMDFPGARTVGDHAYWLSGVRVRTRTESTPRGTIDVRSEGFGVGEPPAGATQTSGGRLTGGTFPALTFARRSKDWGAAPPAPRRDRLVVRATNVSRVVVDPARARVTCRAELEVDSDGPLTVELAGCARRESFGLPARGDGAPAASSCRSANGFARVAAEPARGGRLRISAARLSTRPFTVSVLRQSRGRAIVANRRVATFRDRRRAFTWSGRARRRVGDGIYLVRFTTRAAGGRRDVRRVVVERRSGRFRALPDSYRRASCGLLSSFKLERPVFGGRDNRALGIAFRTSGTARVAVEPGRRATARTEPRRGRRCGWWWAGPAAASGTIPTSPSSASVANATARRRASRARAGQAEGGLDGKGNMRSAR